MCNRFGDGKYRLSEERCFNGCYRIKAIIDIPEHNVKSGDWGGYVESEDNLSQEGSCWIADKSVVRGNAKVTGNALICNLSKVGENARIYGNVIISNSSVCGKAIIGNNVQVKDSFISGEAKIYEDAEVIDSYAQGRSMIYGEAKIVKSGLGARSAVSGSAILREAIIQGSTIVCDNAEVSGKFRGSITFAGDVKAANDSGMFVVEEEVTYNEGVIKYDLDYTTHKPARI